MAKQKTTKAVRTVSDLFAKTFDMELKTNDGEPTGLFLKLVGPDSKAYRDSQMAMFPFVGRPVKDLTADDVKELTKLRLEQAIGCIVGWSDDAMFGGPFSKEAAMDLFSKPEASIIIEQINECLEDRKNFFR